MALKKRRNSLPKFELNYTPHGKQKEFAQAIQNGARVVLFLGGIRSGKTHSVIYECLKQIYQYQAKPNLGWIISPTYPMSLIPERKFVAACQTPNGSLIAKHIAGQRAYLLHPPSSTPGQFFRVEFKSAEDPDRLRGASLAFAALDECSQMSSAAYEVIQGRVLDSRGIILISTTPMGKNWLYHDVYRPYEEGDPHYSVIKATTYDNPWLNPEDIAKLQSQYGAKSDALAKQEILADWQQFEGRVFTHYEPGTHTIRSQDIPENAHIVCGIDWGSNDPFVCVWCARIDGVWFVVDEYYRPHALIGDHASYLKAHPLYRRVKRYWCDPSGLRERRELRALGIEGVLPARRPKEDKAVSWPVMRARLMNTMFAQRMTNPLTGSPVPGLVFMDTVTHGRREFQGLCYERFTEEQVNRAGELIGVRVTDRSGKELDKNAKETLEDKNNHVVDATGYALFSEVRLGPTMHPFYFDEARGETVIQEPKSEKQALKDAHVREMRELFWRAQQKTAKKMPKIERYDTI